MGGAGKTTRSVCVTGAGGFIASWLVHRLLAAAGYVVHGTVRDPSDPKNAHLTALGGAGERLRLFKADVLDYASVAAAVAGCGGVFHVASPVPTAKPHNPDVEVLAPAVAGTANVLRACREGKVGRVVVVSSAAAVAVNPGHPNGTSLDEGFWSDEHYCRATESWYFLSKMLAEREAVAYADEVGLDVVTVCPSLVLGPPLQSTVNFSSSVLINLLKDDSDAVGEDKTRNMVDVRDVADALLLAYEHPAAAGRYICSAYTMKMSEVVTIVKQLYPGISYPKRFVKAEDEKTVCSKKLQMLGWRFRAAEECLRDSVDSYKAAGILKIMGE